MWPRSDGVVRERAVFRADDEAVRTAPFVSGAYDGSGGPPPLVR